MLCFVARIALLLQLLCFVARIEIKKRQIVLPKFNEEVIFLLFPIFFFLNNEHDKSALNSTTTTPLISSVKVEIVHLEQRWCQN